LQFTARLEQSGISAGDIATVSASVTEYDIPVEKRARVWAEVTLPNASSLVLALQENAPGQFEAILPMSSSGLYTLRVRARGETLRGNPFEREQTLSAAAYPAGYQPPSGEPHGRPGWCDLLECLFGREMWPKRATAKLQELGIDPDRLRKCLAVCCRKSPAVLLEHSLGERVQARSARQARGSARKRKRN
jgi:hypothetical protein